MDHDSHEPDYNAVVTVETIPEESKPEIGEQRSS
jgi:hypothetical protein